MVSKVRPRTESTLQQCDSASMSRQRSLRQIKGGCKAGLPLQITILPSPLSKEHPYTVYNSHTKYKYKMLGLLISTSALAPSMSLAGNLCGRSEEAAKWLGNYYRYGILPWLATT